MSETNIAVEASATSTQGRRSEKIGIVSSDKMLKTVVVRVDRLIKHPVYKRYVRRRNKFMAHNEIEGVSIGDRVRIVETRPLSARKRPIAAACWAYAGSTPGLAAQKTQTVCSVNNWYARGGVRQSAATPMRQA